MASKVIIYSPQNSYLAKEPCFCCSLFLLWLRLVFPLCLSKANFEMPDLDTILPSFPAQSLQGKPRNPSVVRAAESGEQHRSPLQQHRPEPPATGHAEGPVPYRSVHTLHSSPSFPHVWYWTVQYQDGSDVICTPIFLKSASNLRSDLLPWMKHPSELAAGGLAGTVPSQQGQAQRARLCRTALKGEWRILHIALETFSSCVLSTPCHSSFKK